MKFGSDLISARLRQGKHPGTKQNNPCAAIHYAFEHLQSVELPFRLSITPWFQDSIADCLKILHHRPGETPHAVDF